jgi:MFS family permease
VTIGIPIATLADRANRRNIVAISLAIWSAMTTLCGLAQNYWHLLSRGSGSASARRAAHRRRRPCLRTSFRLPGDRWR